MIILRRIGNTSMADYDLNINCLVRWTASKYDDRREFLNMLLEFCENWNIENYYPLWSALLDEDKSQFPSRDTIERISTELGYYEEEKK